MSHEGANGTKLEDRRVAQWGSLMNLRTRLIIPPIVGTVVYEESRISSSSDINHYLIRIKCVVNPN